MKDSLDERIQVREQYDLIEYRYRRSVTEYLTFRPLVSDNVGSWNDVSHLLHATRIIDHYDGTETVVLQIL